MICCDILIYFCEIIKAYYRGELYMENNWGPRTAPCGTPYI